MSTLPSSSCKHFQRLDAGAGLVHLVAAGFEHAFAAAPHRLLILDQQHHGRAAGQILGSVRARLCGSARRTLGSSPAGGGLGFGRGGGLLRLVLDMARQVDAESGALAHFGFGIDIAARLLDDAIDHRQPEPGALADILGGEERLENLFHHLRRDSRALVGNLDQHVVADLHAAVVEAARPRRPRHCGS
jgi:hypothetical protein